MPLLDSKSRKMTGNEGSEGNDVQQTAPAELNSGMLHFTVDPLTPRPPGRIFGASWQMPVVGYDSISNEPIPGLQNLLHFLS